MVVKIDRRFEKDVDKVNNRKLLVDLANRIEALEKSANILEIKDLKKLQGGQNYYRIRLGDYRIGALIKSNAVELIRFLPRKDIYKFFP